MAKETIYVDQDDEITAVISKIELAREKVVAVVLPVHSTVFTSSINMKLIKKAEDTYKKSVVLITNNANVLPIAGAAGLHTAKNLASKPILHKVATESKKAEQPIELVDDGSAAVVGTAAAADAVAADSDVIELDNTVKEPKQKGVPFNKKLKVPNFHSFRLKVFLGAFLAVALVVFWIFAAFILPKATVTLKTDVSTVDSVLALQATTDVKDFDVTKPILPATMLETKKSDTEAMPATGKKDVGTKATGSVKMINCNKDDKLSDTIRTVAAGTTITDTNGNQFITQGPVNVEPSSYVGNNCSSNKPSAAVSVVAANSGGQYNLTARAYSVGGFATITANDSTGMGGGTSKMITVISQQDIDAAKAKLAGKSKTAASSELITQLEQSGLIALPETLAEGTPKITNSAAVDAEVAEVTVSQEVSYTMLAVSKDNIKSLIEADVKLKITDDKLKILDNGIDKRQLQITEKKAPNDQKLQITTVATVGPDIDTSGIANEVAGKSRGEIQTLLSKRSGVKDVVVRYDPFWVTKTPSKASKIVVVVEQVNAKQ